VNDSDWAISYGAGLSRRPTKRGYCGYPAIKGHCRCNYFLGFWLSTPCLKKRPTFDLL